MTHAQIEAILNEVFKIKIGENAMTQPQSMRYEWEDDATAKVFADCEGYDVIGVAIANPETGEACFIDMSGAYNGVERADYMQEVHGDVGSVYEMTLENMITTKGEQQ